MPPQILDLQTSVQKRSDELASMDDLQRLYLMHALLRQAQQRVSLLAGGSRWPAAANAPPVWAVGPSDRTSDEFQHASPIVTIENGGDRDTTFVPVASSDVSSLGTKLERGGLLGTLAAVMQKESGPKKKKCRRKRDLRGGSRLEISRGSFGSFGRPFAAQHSSKIRNKYDVLQSHNVRPNAELPRADYIGPIGNEASDKFIDYDANKVGSYVPFDINDGWLSDETAAFDDLKKVSDCELSNQKLTVAS